VIMSALASLPARAAERVKALNAGAPHLAAAATSTLRKADLLSPSAAALLSSLSIPDLLQDDSLQSGLTLREARLVYKDTTAVIATLAANLLAAVFAACAHGHRRQFMQTQLGAGIGMRRFLVTTQLVAGPREGL